MWPYELDLVRKSTMDSDLRDSGEQSSGKRQKEKLIPIRVEVDSWGDSRIG